MTFRPFHQLRLQALSISFAALCTLSVFAAIDELAVHPAADAQLAHASATMCPAKA